jgi:hypothetical protein
VDERLGEALAALRAALAAPRLQVPSGDLATTRTLRDRLVAEVEAHLARIRDLDAPLLAVLGGGTGAGKSTVANSLVGQSVALTGVIRPTTSSPTLLANPEDEHWFTEPVDELDGAFRILPAYARVHPSGRAVAGTQDGRVLSIVTSHAVPRGLALLDAPDVDSVRDEHRELADELLDAADVWVWFVTARTYADEAGMRYLRRAARRRTALAVVLNQVHERDLDEVGADLRRKLADEGLEAVEILAIPHTATQAGRLPDRAITDLRRWLRGLAEPTARERMRRQTLDGALDDLAAGTAPFVAALHAEAGHAAALDDAAETAWSRVPDRFADALDEGPPLRQEIVARWSAFVGTSRFTTLVESATASVRGWLRDALSSATSAEQDRLRRQVQAEVADTMADLVVRVADLAAADTAAAWEATEAGRALLADRPGLRRSDPGLRDRAEEALRGWQDAVAELIATKGAARKVRARWASTILNAAATAAILAAFASTGGLTGVEGGHRGRRRRCEPGAARQAPRRAERRWILRRAREDLIERVADLAAEERARHAAAVAAIAPTPGEADVVEAAVRRVEAARP